MTVQWITLVFAGVAAIVSFQNFRLSGRRRSSEFRQSRLSDLREKISELIAEVTMSGGLVTRQMVVLTEHIGLLLDDSDPAGEVRVAASKLAAATESDQFRDRLRALTDAARKFVLLETRSIERDLRRWFL